MKSSMVEDGDAVADPPQFFQFARGDDDGRPGAVVDCQEHIENAFLGSDIDSSGRLVDDHQPGREGEGMGDPNLLLIAAAQFPHRLGRTGAADVKLPYAAFAMPADGPAIRQAQAPRQRGVKEAVVMLQGGKGDIVHDRMPWQESEPVAVLGQEKNTPGDHRGAGGWGDRRAIQLQAAAEGELSDHAGAERQFAMSGQTDEAEDLAALDIEVEAQQFFSGHRDLEIPDGQDRIVSRSGAEPAGLGDAFPEHQVGDGAKGCRADIATADSPAFPKDRQTVAKATDLREPMGGEENGDPFVRQVAQRCQEVSGVGGVQYRGRLIEEQQPEIVAGDLPGDFDELPDIQGEVPGFTVQIDLEVEVFERPTRLVVVLPRIEQGKITGKECIGEGKSLFAGEQDIFGNRHFRDQGELLMHHADSGCDRLGRRRETEGLSVEKTAAAVTACFVND